MTLKDEFLILWIFCAMLIMFAVRHYFGGMIFLIEHLAAYSASSVLGLLHPLLGLLR